MASAMPRLMTPVLVSGDEATKLIDAQVEGKAYEPKQIKSVPSQFQKWITNNSARINAANNRGTLPYWLRDNAKFTGMKINPINTAVQAEIRKEALQKYNSYGDDWEKAYFDKYSDGFNVCHRDHKFTKTGGGGEAEKAVGKMLAKYNGKQVEFLPEGNKKGPDVSFDNKKWDIKYIDQANEGTIRKYLLDARKADNAIFYWNTNEKFNDLNNAAKREIGRLLKGQINGLPDIYYMDKNGLLKLLWEKQKGTNS
jgi:hypothetical protein